MNYSDTLISAISNTPQTSPLFGRESEMVQNHEGGFVFSVDELTILDRFLIIGSERNAYYATSKQLVVENATNVLKLISSKSNQVVDRIVEISSQGRAPKNDSAIFALGLTCVFAPTPEERTYAFNALPKVCRIGTHLFQFVDFIKKFSKWNAITKRGIANWYNSKELNSLSFQVLKYQKRNNWSHRDVLRLAHVKPTNIEYSSLFAWITDSLNEEKILYLPKIFKDYEKLHKYPSIDNALVCIERHNMSWEMLPTQLLKSPEIWIALIPKMGYTALIRNLGRMSSIGTLDSLSDSASIVIDKLLDENLIKRGKVHPLNIYSAYKTYAQGYGEKGKLSWKVNANILSALGNAFYKAFHYLEPTNKKYLIGLDCSGSMFNASVNGDLTLSAAEASAIMAMSIIKTEKNVWVGGFDTSISELDINSSMSLDEVMRKMSKFRWGGTDCSQPFRYALKHKMDVDCFISFTDNETYAGSRHGSQALNEYRAAVNKPNAKSIVCATSVSDFSIADPKDPNQLDLVGFDSAIPLLISEFVK